MIQRSAREINADGLTLTFGMADRVIAYVDPILIALTFPMVIAAANVIWTDRTTPMSIVISSVGGVGCIYPLYKQSARLHGTEVAFADTNGFRYRNCTFNLFNREANGRESVNLEVQCEGDVPTAKDLGTLLDLLFRTGTLYYR
jgi:hypothetical protein